ncbi:snaclec coagulation factor IX/factor X-binding protein subunit B-like isoform X2 [Sipha flava]|uniref:Snaclec coagulation factor IX/factor X-binding protein subunit B-like isoform X2 n=1 Tax=Sipha flava TaxID=143950 RepID=A0A8B8G7L3_9HEMI|nr:snaclec coagulation factor IX/factor X-binding protein subunit B-like isoform X2 [Sipha flava]
MNFKTLPKIILFYHYLLLNVLFFTSESKLMYNCKNGFSKFGNNCFYLSTKTATWQEAYFECKYLAKGSKLAVLYKEVDDHNIRKFLKYRHTEIKERWIGGLYDWNQDQWKWATSGRKIQYNHFEKIPYFDQNDKFMCMAIDPNINYKWTARNVHIAQAI